MLAWFQKFLIILKRAFRSGSDELKDIILVICGTAPVMLVGFILSLVVCNHFWARGAMWCLACFLVGAAIGFLFGVPRVSQRSPKDLAKADAEAGRYEQSVNTNLEDISDWLTKIIVGLGLVQLSRLPSWISTLATLFANSIGLEPAQNGVLAAMILFFLVGGFLLSYLLTRLFLQGALGRADRAAGFPDEEAVQKSKASAAVETEPPLDALPSPANPENS